MSADMEAAALLVLRYAETSLPLAASTQQALERAFDSVANDELRVALGALALRAHRLRFASQLACVNKTLNAEVAETSSAPDRYALHIRAAALLECISVLSEGGYLDDPAIAARLAELADNDIEAPSRSDDDGAEEPTIEGVWSGLVERVVAACEVAVDAADLDAALREAAMQARGGALGLTISADAGMLSSDELSFFGGSALRMAESLEPDAPPDDAALLAKRVKAKRILHALGG